MKKILGINHFSPELANHYARYNMNSGILVAIFLGVAEAWMLLSPALLSFSASDFGGAVFDPLQFGIRMLLLLASVFVWIFAYFYLKKRLLRSRVAQTVKYIYSFICILCGIVLSALDFANNEQILAFTTMILLVFGVFIWRPVLSLSSMAVSFTIFFVLCGNVREISMSVKFNITVTYIVAAMISIGRYFQWIHESDKIFEVDQANRELEDANMELEESYISLEESNNALKVSNEALAKSNRDVTALNSTLAKTNKHLKYVSDRDYLTGLYTPRGFRRICKSIIRSLPQSASSDEGLSSEPFRMSYVHFNLNNFKGYNVQYGFPVGNIFLKDFSRFLEEVFHNEADPNSHYSALSREGNDHFIAFAPSENLDAKIRLAVDFVERYRRNVYMRLCAGVYELDDMHMEVGVGVDRARFACNIIKNNPHVTVNFYNSELEKEINLKRHITGHIDEAIQNEEIKVYYQPIVDIATGEIVEIEALSRWDDSQKGFLSPASFIPALEESRQIYKLDCFVAEKSCQNYLLIREKKGKTIPVSINFSRVDFEIMDVCGFLKNLADKYGIPREHIEVEVTESALTSDRSFLKEKLECLKESGFCVWLDDFGSGYSSLNTLKDYKFDVIKIDMEFLRNLENSPNTGIIMRSIISLCNDLKTVTLTEGVETKDQLEFLKELGCVKAQGYYFSKPVPIDELMEKSYVYET